MNGRREPHMPVSTSSAGTLPPSMARMAMR